MRQSAWVVVSACLLLCLAGLWGKQPAGLAQVPTPVQPSSAPKAQLRAHGQPVDVDPASISVDDGDSVFIHWAGGDDETVRILGIDSPEVRHDEHGIPRLSHTDACPFRRNQGSQARTSAVN
jgi:micrococcal nuclease